MRAYLAQNFSDTPRSSLGQLWPLVAFGVGLASLLSSARAAGELRYILECAGAIGGTRQRP